MSYKVGIIATAEEKISEAQQLNDLSKVVQNTVSGIEPISCSHPVLNPLDHSCTLYSPQDHKFKTIKTSQPTQISNYSQSPTTRIPKTCSL